ncbi:MAG: hypothetical protein NVS3B18_06460 [Candidatus Dormibacteria bacterium]
MGEGNRCARGVLGWRLVTAPSAAATLTCGGLLGAAVAVEATTRSDWLLLLAAPALAVVAVLLAARVRALEIISASLAVGWITQGFVTHPGSSNGLQRTVAGASALAAIASIRWRPAIIRAVGNAASALADRLQPPALATAASLALAPPLGTAANRAGSDDQTRRAAPQLLSCGSDLLMSRLSQRQREVVALVLEGLSAREIGTRLFISERTVETHIANVYERLDIHSRHQLMRSHDGIGLRVLGPDHDPGPVALAE